MDLLKTGKLIASLRRENGLTVELYPEQDGELRLPQMRGGKCTITATLTDYMNLKFEFKMVAKLRPFFYFYFQNPQHIDIQTIVLGEKNERLY